MRSPMFAGLGAYLFLTTSVQAADCTKEQDYRSNRNAGLLITNFIITGTQTLTSEEPAPMRSKLTGSCINEDPDE